MSRPSAGFLSVWTSMLGLVSLLAAPATANFYVPRDFEGSHAHGPAIDRFGRNVISRSIVHEDPFGGRTTLVYHGEVHSHVISLDVDPDVEAVHCSRNQSEMIVDFYDATAARESWEDGLILVGQGTWGCINERGTVHAFYREIVSVRWLDDNSAYLVTIPRSLHWCFRHLQAEFETAPPADTVAVVHEMASRNLNKRWSVGGALHEYNWDVFAFNYNKQTKRASKPLVIVNSVSLGSALYIGCPECYSYLTAGFRWAIKVGSDGWNPLPHLRLFRIELYGDFKINLDFLIKAHYSYHKVHDHNIFSITVATLAFAIGPIPVWIDCVIYLDSKTKIDIEAEGNATFGFDYFKHMSTGIWIEDGQNKAIAPAYSEYNKHPTESYFVAKIDICQWLIPKVGLELYSLVPFTASLMPYLGALIDIGDNSGCDCPWCPYYQLYGGLDFRLAIEVIVIKFSIPVIGDVSIRITFGVLPVQKTWELIPKTFLECGICSGCLFGDLTWVEWDTTEWGFCTKHCGGGTQTREVFCPTQTLNVDRCDPAAKPPTSQACNTHACCDNCATPQLGNKVCEPFCFSSECKFDGGDCTPNINTCSKKLTCTECTGTQHCGWCSSTKTCMFGNWKGPLSSTCPGNNTYSNNDCALEIKIVSPTGKSSYKAGDTVPIAWLGGSDGTIYGPDGSILQTANAFQLKFRWRQNNVTGGWFVGAGMPDSPIQAGVVGDLGNDQGGSLVGDRRFNWVPPKGLPFSTNYQVMVQSTLNKDVADISPFFTLDGLTSNGNCLDCPSYFWLVDADYDVCSRPCGGGVQRRNVYCYSRLNQVVEDSKCADYGDPDRVRGCNLQDCPDVQIEILRPGRPTLGKGGQNRLIERGSTVNITWRGGLDGGDVEIFIRSGMPDPNRHVGRVTSIKNATSGQSKFSVFEDLTRAKVGTVTPSVVIPAKFKTDYLEKPSFDPSTFFKVATNPTVRNYYRTATGLTSKLAAIDTNPISSDQILLQKPVQLQASLSAAMIAYRRNSSFDFLKQMLVMPHSTYRQGQYNLPPVSVPNTGVFTWRVPADMPLRGDYQLKICSYHNKTNCFETVYFAVTIPTTYVVKMQVVSTSGTSATLTSSFDSVELTLLSSNSDSMDTLVPGPFRAGEIRWHGVRALDFGAVSQVHLSLKFQQDDLAFKQIVVTREHDGLSSWFGLVDAPLLPPVAFKPMVWRPVLNFIPVLNITTKRSAYLPPPDVLLAEAQAVLNSPTSSESQRRAALNTQLEVKNSVAMLTKFNYFGASTYLSYPVDQVKLKTSFSSLVQNVVEIATANEPIRKRVFNQAVYRTDCWGADGSGKTRSCTGCVTTDGCGWCQTSLSCVPGTTAGPLEGTCASWIAVNVSCSAAQHGGMPLGSPPSLEPPTSITGSNISYEPFMDAPEPESNLENGQLELLVRGSTASSLMQSPLLVLLASLFLAGLML